MTTKEIIARARLTDGFDKKNQNTLFCILRGELLSAYKEFKGEDNERLFEASVKKVRTKWRAIDIKVPFGLPEGLWGYFYAAYVIPAKKALCPTWKVRNDNYNKKYGKENK